MLERKFRPWCCYIQVSLYLQNLHPAWCRFQSWLLCFCSSSLLVHLGEGWRIVQVYEPCTLSWEKWRNVLASDLGLAQLWLLWQFVEHTDMIFPTLLFSTTLSLSLSRV